jgi:hypothetical protein
MNSFTLDLEVFGAGSLAIAFAKYTKEKRKTHQSKDNMKNNSRCF